ncbi:DUF5615 family PIN-like protein [candidate division KSB1 bacterium]|nr:DUF5615 family PIN-like protein [candidate division KSB1 bacterium]
MKFLADMGISPKTVDFLIALGFESIHLSALKLNKMLDSEILNKAKNEGFILLTHDLDFSELVAASKAKLPSVIIFRLRNMQPNNVNSTLKKIVTNHSSALKQGAIISVTDSQIRVRQLPIKSI